MLCFSRCRGVWEQGSTARPHQRQGCGQQAGCVAAAELSVVQAGGQGPGPHPCCCQAERAPLRLAARQAIKHLERVLDISREMGDYVGDADAYGVIADIYTDLGEWGGGGRVCA